jgi:imidazolonepropionase-like amidohydrolase
MLGKEHEVGSIETGKKANILILRENPTINIKNITSAFV